MTRLSATIIANPKAGTISHKRIEETAGFLRGSGMEIDILLTQKPGDGEGLAISAVAKKPSMIVAMGGDGTVNEVINGMLCGSGSDVPLAVLPLGTTNVLVRELGIPLDYKKALLKIVGASARSVSLGKISFEGKTRHFALMAGVGFDAKCVYGISLGLKSVAGKAAYVVSGLVRLAGWNPSPLEIEVDGRKLPTGYSAIISNSSKYAGDFQFSPHTDIGTPEFYVFVMHSPGKFDMLKYTAAILAGQHTSLKDVTYAPAKKVAIKGDAHIQLDGDYMGKTPAEIEIVPAAIKLVY